MDTASPVVSRHAPLIPRDKTDLLSASFELAVEDYGLPFPSDEDNRIGARKTMPGLLEAVDGYSSRTHIPKSRVVSGAATLGIFWIEKELGTLLDAISSLKDELLEKDYTDLETLVGCDGFLASGWNDRPRKFPIGKINVGKVSGIASSLGTSSFIICQLAIAWAVTKSETSFAGETTNKKLVPQVIKFQEAILVTMRSMETIKKIVDRREQNNTDKVQQDKGTVFPTLGTRELGITNT